MNPLDGLGAAVTAASTAAERANADKVTKLKATTKQLEGVFVEQMFKAMRETVPDDGVVSGGQGEEIFSGLLDQKIADEVPAQWHRGIADALFREMRGHVPSESK